MTVVCGIDEAGYGPSLGPLVVAGAAFRLEAGTREAALHRLLQLSDFAGGLRLADSKRVWSGPHSLAALETAVLGHVALARGVLPLRVATLLNDAVDFGAEEAEELPWYAGRLLPTRLPRRADPAALLERAERQGELLADRGLAFAGFAVAPVPEPRFNHVTQVHGSKAWPLFLAAARLMDTFIARFPADELVIHVDRQGGRQRYGELLQGFFPLAPLTVLREKPAESSYRLSPPGRPPVLVVVRVKGDATRAPVALASMLAKYVRELFMESLNAWFAEQRPGVRPTAGYPQDARRFLEDVDAVVERTGIRARLVRVR